MVFSHGSAACRLQFGVDPPIIATRLSLERWRMNVNEPMGDFDED
jgi:hypothetical protein